MCVCVGEMTLIYYQTQKSVSFENNEGCDIDKFFKTI